MSSEPEPPPTKRTRLDEDEGEDEQGAKTNAGIHVGGALKKADEDGGSSSSSTALDGVISPLVMAKAEALAESYRTATPYRHGLIEDLCVDGFMEKVLDEVKQNSKVKFKESDLFRVYQSIDLANLSDASPLAKNMPRLMELRAALYSAEYRAFVERISDLKPGTLTGQVDCAANCHTKGCHLLCHDDVIGTRKVSYIMYLTDPEPTWRDEDGGRLELYENIAERNGGEEGSSSRRVPGPFPVKTVLPHFNSLAYFVVTPGVSFHSVQEVFCDRPRLSIQGWYHAADEPAQMANATLNRLKSTAKGEDTEGSFTAYPRSDAIAASAIGSGDDDSPPALSKSDRDYLAKYINDTYLSDKSANEIRECFEETSSVQLRHFLNEEWSRKIKGATSREDAALGLGRSRPSLDYGAGVTDDWVPVGPAHKQRFLEYSGKEEEEEDGNDGTNSAGALLLHLKRAVFESPIFGRWLECLTSLGMPTGHRGRVRRFRPGLDYTVAHYGILTKRAVLDATVCFAAGAGRQCQYDEEVGDLVGNDDDAIWESGDAGGFECYIAADDDEDGKKDEEAADEYNDEDDTELLSVSASDNTLSLVYRDPGTMRFVKYVGASAPSSRWDISLEYEVEEGDEVEVEGEDDPKVDGKDDSKEDFIGF